MSAQRRLQGIVRKILLIPAVKKRLLHSRLIAKVHPGWAWERGHPIDDEYGIETSGYVPTEEIHPDKEMRSLINGYGPSQPTIVRQSLNALGNIEGYTFIDLGCGKGRVAVIASEFPFRAVVGVELSPALADIARANAAVIQGRFSTRPAITILEENAVDFQFPDGNLVIFMFHSFGRELLTKIIRTLENRLSTGIGHLFYICYNPVNGDLLDQSSAFTQCFAETLSCDPSEADFGPTKGDSVAIWQAGQHRS